MLKLEAEAPEWDTEQQPLWEHLAELRSRMVVVLAFVVLVAAATFPFSREALSTITGRVATGGVRVAVYTPIEYLVVQIYLMLAVGLGLAVPLIIHQAYAFMAPGLYSKERCFYLAAVPASALLMGLGAALAWFVVVPEIAPVLMASGGEVVTPAISIERIFFFVVGLMFLTGLVFQVPVATALAVWSGAATPQWLLDRRLYLYLGFFFLASVLTVDPTMASQTVLTAIFVALFEASVRIANRFA